MSSHNSSSHNSSSRNSSNGNSSDRDHSNKATPARVAALKTVAQCRIREAFAHDVIAQVIDNSSMSVNDRAFAAKLVLGVTSMRGVLDDVLDRSMNSPHDVTDEVRDALCISTYEILFLDKDAYAAVDQGVELVRSIAPRASGLANAVLRRVSAAQDDFPFGDPATDLAAFARQVGFPLWLAEYLVKDLGEQDARKFMEVSNDQAPVFVAINTIKVTEQEAIAILEKAQGNPQPVKVEGCAVDGCYFISSGQVLLDEDVQQALAEGWIFVSDAASQLVAQSALSDALPRTFLEIGAGRGTKTLLLQNNAWRNWDSQIEDYAVLDNHDFKIALLIDRARNFGVHVSESFVGNACNLSELVGRNRMFEGIFIDAPCSGLGTLRRHPEIRWRLTCDTITAYAQQGYEMLESAARFVAPGGILAYSTCTVTSVENTSVISRFLESEQGSYFNLESINGKDFLITHLKQGGNDAHFLAKMRRV